MTSEELNENLVVIGSVYAENGLVTMHKKLTDYLSSPASKQITAMLCLTEELSTAAVAACRTTGRTVPEKMSIMEYAWSQRSAFYNPPRTGICTHIDKHIDLAVDLLIQIRNGTTPKMLRHFVKPELIVRETVAPPWRG
jgi:DNA-binding LacI/PurR family transcriptional regulator